MKFPTVISDEILYHDDVIKWKHFPCYWPFVRGIHRRPVNSPHKGQWRGALIFSLICARINSWVNNREVCDLRRHRAHYDVIVMCPMFPRLRTSCSTHSDRPAAWAKHGYYLQMMQWVAQFGFLRQHDALAGTQQTHYAIMPLLLRQNDVILRNYEMTSIWWWRYHYVMCSLGK